MYRLVSIAIVATLTLSACQWLQPVENGSAIDLDKARAVSDAFMRDMVSDDVAQALKRMEPEFVESMSARAAEQAIRQLFEYCGRPTDMEYKADQVGFRVYSDGRKKSMRKLFYAATTTMEQKGVCFFAVEIVPYDKELMVASFGPLKLGGGTLPDWLR